MEKFQKIKNIVLVLSGKGGVGKSTVSSFLAVYLRKLNFTVGLLDIDITGPNIPRILGIDSNAQVVQNENEEWLPIIVDSEQKFKVMSIGFLIGRTDAVIWRGPRKHAMIKQFILGVEWGELDWLIIDTPPGTSDEHISLVELLHQVVPKAELLKGIEKIGEMQLNLEEKEEEKQKTKIGAIMVSTPQQISVIDVRKEVNFCVNVDLPIIGLIENMSGFVCPNCDKIHYIFSSDGGADLAKSSLINFLGKVPLDPRVSEICDLDGALVLLDDSSDKNNLSKIVSDAYNSIIKFLVDWSKK
ncbi:nucleotide-binding protein nbp35 [Anaeramoeba ignava]|uniref:Nucleotide-binding protein nbp35 n=1 Tax=Anaeramoeba ignava TaxID=1746090 RepID=A0A9Q0L7U0_ANAIG|nr:nucleotide-binding protein nbp35 [Anaeramoeba ignava]